MSESRAHVRTFNLETMSGVFPGTRTQLFQRVRLAPLEGDAPPCWALCLWYDTPPALLVVRQDLETGRPQSAPLLRIEQPAAGDLNRRLQAALAESGWRLLTCGACAHWRPSPSRTPDGLAVGSCGLRRAAFSAEGAPPEAAPPEPLAALAGQSHLALECPHHRPLPAAAHSAGDAQAAHAQEVEGPTLPLAPLPKIAELSESKLKPWPRLRLRLQRALARALPSRPAPPPRTPADLLAERSGVGAGTEPCFACQGRIANLGALTVASADGDKQTFSVWRCRLCATLYLSDWTDRWERVDSLETEETIYRIAPVEAAELLALFASIPAGDHPANRHERTPQRDWIHAQFAGRAPLSHIVKQGR